MPKLFPSDCSSQLAKQLHLAVHDGQKKTVDLLIAAKANPNAPDHAKRTHLYYAKTTDIAQLLLKAKASINHQDKWEMTPLHSIVCRGNVEVARLLLDAKASVNAQIEYGDMPLHEAIRAKNSPMIELILGKKADINAHGRQNKTAAYWANRGHKYECLKIAY